METPLVRVTMAREILRKGEPVKAVAHRCAIGSSPMCDGSSPLANAYFAQPPATHVYMRERGRSPGNSSGRVNLLNPADCPICYPAGELHSNSAGRAAIMRGSRCGSIRARPRRVSSERRSCGPRSDAFGTITGRSTGFAKPGGSCTVKVKLWRGSHRSTPRGWHGIARNCSRKGSENNDPRQASAMPTR